MSNETKKRVMHQNLPTEPGRYWVSPHIGWIPELHKVIWLDGRLHVSMGRFVSECPGFYWSDLIEVDEWVMPKVEE